MQTCRGSHTHSVVASDERRIVVYNSGTAGVRDEEELTDCIGNVAGDTRTALFRIDVIEIPVADPSRARIIDSPAVFADPATGVIAGLWRGGDHGDETQETSETNQCHDITVFPSAGIAAGACSGNGIVFDIRDPLKPQRIDAVVDKGFAYWHSATFNNDGTKVIFTDEWGGGGRPRCRAHDPLDWGADAVYDLVDGKLQYRSHFKMPAPQVDEENCVAHNGSIVPVPGRDIMVQAWYQGGISVWDFTDSAAPVEIAYFDRGPIDAEELALGGYWSSYWYDGRIYATEIARGLDVFALQPSEFLTANEIAAAASPIRAAVQPAAAVPGDVAGGARRGAGLRRSAAARQRRADRDTRCDLRRARSHGAATGGEHERRPLGRAVGRARARPRCRPRRRRHAEEKEGSRRSFGRPRQPIAVIGADAPCVSIPPSRDRQVACQIAKNDK